MLTPLLIVAFEFLTLDVQPGRFPNKGGTESCLVAISRSSAIASSSAWVERYGRRAL